MAPAIDRLRSRIRASLAPLTAFGVTLAAGFVGFVLIAGVGVVEAAFWLVDPASIELYFQEHAGPARATKAYAVVVFTALVLTGLWVGESVVDTAFGGQVREELRRVQQERAIESTSDHVIVCGFGMFGRTLTERLVESGRTVVVIERDQSIVAGVEVTDLVVDGDARREATLERAGVGRADAVICAIDDSNANVQIAVVAGQLSPETELVVRVGEEMYESVAHRAGADTVVIPEKVSAERVVDAL